VPQCVVKLGYRVAKRDGDILQLIYPSVRTRWDAGPGYRPASLKTVFAG
jgi:hypothetical protein